MDSSIKFNVSANTAQFQSGMKQVDAAAKSTAAGIKQAFSGVQSMIVGGAALAGLKTLMNDFDKVAKVATRFGASAEEIQRVSVAADLAGTSIDTVARVLTKLSVAASDAGTGNKEMAESFARAGINAEKFKNSGLDEQLVQLSEAFNRARGDADATNQIIELMGTRAASQMIPLIDNTTALRQEMEGVAVASDDVVRKIEAANDRMTRLGNDAKVALAGMLEGFINLSERLGSLMADLEGMAKLSAAIPLALTGNVMPLWHVLQTGKTIAEMEEIEARAAAIAQLTNEGVFGMDAVKNAELIAERTAQILEQTRGTAQQIQIAEDSTDRVLSLEKEKTAELDRQQQVLERQEEQRQRSIRSIEQEIRLMEAQLSGNKDLEESLRQQADFDDAMEKTGSFETASNFAATKAAERQSQEAVGSLANITHVGGGLLPANDPTMEERIGEMRGRARGAAATEAASRHEGLGRFRSAVRAQDRAQRAMDRAMQSARVKDILGGKNMGDAYKEYQDKTGMDRMSRQEFEKSIREAAKTEKEREEGASPKGRGGPGDAHKPIDDPAQVVGDIYKLLTERLPIRVLAP